MQVYLVVGHSDRLPHQVKRHCLWLLSNGDHPNTAGSPEPLNPIVSATFPLPFQFFTPLLTRQGTRWSHLSCLFLDLPLSSLDSCDPRCLDRIHL
jgi:hypothetical protein